MKVLTIIQTILLIIILIIILFIKKDNENFKQDISSDIQMVEDNLTEFLENTNFKIVE